MHEEGVEESMGAMGSLTFFFFFRLSFLFLSLSPRALLFSLSLIPSESIRI